MKSKALAFQTLTPCSLVDEPLHFGEKYYLHLKC